MPRVLNRLSARTVASLKEPGLHADGAGLYLRVDPEGRDESDRVVPGAKRWVFIFQWERKRKEMGLGSARLISLAEARDKALAAGKLVATGKNPILVRRGTEVGAPTFGDVADDVVASIVSTNPNDKHLSQWKSSLEVHAKALRPKLPEAISTEDVLDVLRPIWTTIPETAARTRGRIERVLDAAKVRGLRAGENPARWRGHLSLLLPKRQKLYRGHHPALPYAKLPAFMVELAGRAAMSARALEFTILTAARTGETLGARWSEIDLDERIWTVPAERMKARETHRVPLSPAVVAALQAQRAAQEEAFGPEATSKGLVFASGRPDKQLSNMTMEMLLRRMKVDEITVHGFRSTFRDWAGEETDHPREVIEAALAHNVGSEVERAYRRGDALEKRRRLMDDWARACRSPT